MPSLMCVALGFSLSAFSQTPQPVPPGWLHDGKIVVEEYNFSLVSPNENSKWSYVRLGDIDGGKATAFLVDASKDARYLVAVWDMPSGANSISIKSFVDNFVNGMKETMPKDWRIDDAKMEPSDFPQAHSLKIKIAIHMSNDSTMYANGYLVTANRTYMIIDFSPKTVESPQFTQFAGSFAFLSPPVPSSALGFSAYHWLIVAALLGYVWLLVKVFARPS